MIDILEGTMKSYGLVLREARKAKGWTLDELARKARTNKGYISGIENSATKPPATKLSNRLANALGLDPKDLLRRAWAEKAPEPIRAEIIALLFPKESGDRG